MNKNSFKENYIHLTENVLPALVGIAFILFVIWVVIKMLIGVPSNIANSDTYLWIFDNEKYDLKQQEKRQNKQDFLNIKKQKCEILIQAKKDIIPLEMKRYLLHGYSYEKATRYAYKDIEKDEKLCTDKGISPYKNRRDDD